MNNDTPTETLLYGELIQFDGRTVSVVAPEEIIAANEALTAACARIAELEADKARLDWLVDALDVDCEINGAVPLDHIDNEAWMEQGGNECDATRAAWRAAIDAARTSKEGS
jgi:hypothetical protein